MIPIRQKKKKETLQGPNKIVYLSDLKTVMKIRKRLNRNRFSYQICKASSNLLSVSFKIEQIKPQNLQILSDYLDLVSFSPEIQQFSLSVPSFKIEKPEFLELLRRIFSISVKSSFQFQAPNLPFSKEILGYFTKFLITSYRHLTVLDLDLSGSRFGDDGVGVFGLGIVNLKLLQSLRLDLSQSKMRGVGLITVLTNMKALKRLNSFELNCQGINSINEAAFKETYLSLLKLMKSFTSVQIIKLDFSENHLGPECVLKTIALFLKNSYFDKLQKLSLNLNKNCNSRLWDLFESFNNSHKKILYDKYLNSLELNLKANSIGDSNFRHFYDILIRFKGIKSVTLNLRDNKLKQFRSNLFFIFGSFGHNTSLESVDLDLTGNFGVLVQNFSINGDHLPTLENLEVFSLKSGLPNINKKEMVFGNFLKKLLNISKCHIFIPPSDNLDPGGISIIFDSICTMKRLKSLSFELTSDNFWDRDYSELVKKLMRLEKMESLRLAIRNPSYNPLRENFSGLISLKKVCKNLVNLSITTRKEDLIDQKFKKEVIFISKWLLQENIFFEVENFDGLSSLFRRKRGLLLMAMTLRRDVRPILKRNYIINELLELFV